MQDFRQFEQPPIEPMYRDAGAISPGWAMWFSRVADKLRPPELYRISITPTSIGASSTAAQVFSNITYKNSLGDTINDPAKTILNSSDIVFHVEPPSETSGIAISHARVTDDDEITIQFANVTAGGVTPVAGTYKILVLRG